MGEAGESAPPPVDLDALARHATSLSGEFERAWSNALKAIGLEDAEEEFGIKLQALLGGLTAAITESENRLSRAGVDPKVYAWPGDPDAFKGLVKTTDLRARREQLEIAQMVSLERFSANGPGADHTYARKHRPGNPDSKRLVRVWCFFPFS
jgi:hypothetical protein